MQHAFGGERVLGWHKVHQRNMLQVHVGHAIKFPAPAEASSNLKLQAPQ
jgi:hypothetical protein